MRGVRGSQGGRRGQGTEEAEGRRREEEAHRGDRILGEWDTGHEEKRCGVGQKKAGEKAAVLLL